MTKEEEIMAFLNTHVFGLVLNSRTASRELESGVNLTISPLKGRTAEGMVMTEGGEKLIIGTRMLTFLNELGITVDQVQAVYLEQMTKFKQTVSH